MPKPKVALYARVSTSDKGQSTEVQLKELREYCTKQGWDNVTEYLENVSAVKTRPVLNNLINDCYHQKINVIVVWKMDRFSRSLKEFVINITNLDNAGVRFIAMTQGIDTDASNPVGRLIMNILVSLAEFERELIKDRVNAGLELAKANGVKLGRPKVKSTITEAVVDKVLLEGLSMYAALKWAKENKILISATTLSRRVKERQDKEKNKEKGDKVA